MALCMVIQLLVKMCSPKGQVSSPQILSQSSAVLLDFSAEGCCFRAQGNIYIMMLYNSTIKNQQLMTDMEKEDARSEEKMYQHHWKTNTRLLDYTGGGV